MANRKVKPSGDYHFLPKRVQESTKLSTTEKNLLATLCFFRLNYSDYAEKHDGWFYTSQKELEEGTELSHKHLNRVLMDLILKKAIERKSGTNHRCTHYRLHPKIVELLPKVEGDFVDNDTLAIISDKKSTNDTLVEKTTVETVNDTLDKIRLDKSSKDLDSLIYNSTEEDDASILAKIEASSQRPKINESEFYEHWKNELTNCKSAEQLKETLMRMVSSLPSRDAIKEVYLESLKDLYDKLQYSLKFGGQKKKKK